MVDVVTHRICVYQTACYVSWCSKYRRDVLTWPVAEGTRKMLDAICTELVWPVINTAKFLNGTTARLLLQSVSAFQQRLWGGHLWLQYCNLGTAGNISAEMMRRFIARSEHLPKR